LLETLPPGEELPQAYSAMALVHAVAGRPADTLALCSRVLDLATASNQRKIAALTYRAWARAMLGDPAFLEDDHEAIRLARQHALGVPYLLTDTLSTTAEDFWLAEGPEAALADWREAHEIARRKGLTSTAAASEANSL